MIHQASRVSEARRVRDQRLQGLPLVADTVRHTRPADWIGGLFAVAVVVSLMVLLP